ncbi:uncharacterized protein LOC144819324 isoform X1 [Lissotriton helveticus]
MSRSGRQPTAGPCALFLFLTLLISSASDTGPTPTTDLSNRDKHRKPFRFFEDPQRRMSLVLRKLNTTGMIDVRGAVIQLDAEEKETLRTTIALVAALYGLAALYGILHLPVWDNEREAFPDRSQGDGHNLRPGDQVMIKIFHRVNCFEPRCRGPVQVLLATGTAV